MAEASLLLTAFSGAERVQLIECFEMLYPALEDERCEHMVVVNERRVDTKEVVEAVRQKLIIRLD